MWVGIIAAVCAAAAVLLPPLLPPPTRSEVANSEPALTPDDAGKVCLELSENSKEYLSGEEMERRTAAAGAPPATWHLPPRPTI